MRLHLVVGYDECNDFSDPRLVYLGTDGDAARKALDARLETGEFAMIKWTQPVGGIRKFASDEARQRFLDKKRQTLKIAASQSEGPPQPPMESDPEAAAESVQNESPPEAPPEPPTPPAGESDESAQLIEESSLPQPSSEGKRRIKK